MAETGLKVSSPTKTSKKEDKKGALKSPDPEVEDPREYVVTMTQSLGEYDG